MTAQWQRILSGSYREAERGGVTGARLRQLEHRINRTRDMMNAYARNMSKAEGRYVTQRVFQNPTFTKQFPRSVYAADTHYTRNPYRNGSVFIDGSDRDAMYRRTRR